MWLQSHRLSITVQTLVLLKSVIKVSIIISVAGLISPGGWQQDVWMTATPVAELPQVVL